MGGGGAEKGQTLVKIQSPLWIHLSLGFSGCVKYNIHHLAGVGPKQYLRVQGWINSLSGSQLFF